MFSAFRVALTFLTTLPVGYPKHVSSSQRRDALLWYPAAGAVVGLTLWLLARWLPTENVLGAGLLLAVWIVLTGALHLDGLADSVDAWFGGLGDRARTMQIMKDPSVGTMAVVALIVVIGLKFLAIVELLGSGAQAFLIAVPIVARMAPLLLFLTTDYVRPGGIGTDLLTVSTARRGVWLSSGGAVLVVLLVLGWNGVWIVVAALLTLAIVRKVAVNRLGGFTGDVAGAAIELVELACCVTLALA